MYQNCLLDPVSKRGESKKLLSAAEDASPNDLESTKQKVGARDRAVTHLAAHANKKDTLSVPQHTPLVSREPNSRRTLARDLEARLAELDEAIVLMERLSGDSSANSPSLRTPHDPARVFLVHEHAEGARERADRFLEIVGLGPIILYEQPNTGETIIEKLERLAHAGFAVVLLTADSEGQTLNERVLRPGARQGVVFGAGLLMGHAGVVEQATLRRKSCDRLERRRLNREHKSLYAKRW